jgi:hypothetical protein
MWKTGKEKPSINIRHLRRIMAGRLPCVKLACGGGRSDMAEFWERVVVAYKQQVPAYPQCLRCVGQAEAMRYKI